VVLGIWTVMIVMAVEDSVICHYEDAEIFIFCVNDKFTGDLQPSAMPHSTFISIKLIRYFSCVIRNAPFPARFTKIKFSHETLPTAEITSATFTYFLHALTHNQFCVLKLLRLLFIAVNSNQFLIQNYIP